MPLTDAEDQAADEMVAKRLALGTVKARMLRRMRALRAQPGWTSVPPEGRTELAHPESAAWALGALDADEARRFEQHLGTCVHCQAAVAEFEPVTQVLHSATPPPGHQRPDLQARTLARAARQARAGAAPGQAARRRSRPRRPARMVAAAAAVGAVAAVLVAGLVILPRLEASPAGAVAIGLHAVSGRASGTAVAHRRAGGWSITLSVHGLRDLGAGRYYECWYAGPGSRPGHRELIPAGTFTTGRSGTASITMWSAADPRQFPTMEITAEAPGDGRQHGTVVLTGMAQT